MREIYSGETLSGIITGPSFSDAFTFTGQAGDTVIINAVKTSGDLDTGLALYSPTGVNEDWTYSYDQISCTLEETGTYTIMVSDAGLDHAGTYNLTLQKIPGAVSSTEDPDGGAIASGQTLSGTVNVASDMDAFTFTGQAGDTVIINAVKTSGDLDTGLALYSPTGVNEDWTYSYDQISCTLEETGTYTIIVSDAGLDHAGTYNIDLTLEPFYDEGEFWLETQESEATQSSETIAAVNATLANDPVSGDLSGVIDFSNYQQISIQTGAFAGKGFITAAWNATLEGANYTGQWHALSYDSDGDRRIYVKGMIDGDLRGTTGGYLTETVASSGVFDRYETSWQLTGSGDQAVSATLNISGTISHEGSPSLYPATTLNILQTSMDGQIYGTYAGPLSAVLTGVSVADDSNPFLGKGFSLLSYNWNGLSDQGWTYTGQTSAGIHELKGMLDGPLAGSINGSMDSHATPSTFNGKVERMNVGRPVQSELKVKVLGPERVSPGQTVEYVIEYRNDGLKASGDVVLFFPLDPALKYLSSSQGTTYSDFYHEFSTSIGQIQPKTVGYLNVKAEVAWGLPQGATLDSFTYLINLEDSEARVSQRTDIFLNGINTPQYSDNGKKAEEFANKANAEWIPVYGTDLPMGWLPDAIDVQKATPSYIEILAYDEHTGQPIVGWDPNSGNWIYAPPDYQRISYMAGKEYCVYYAPNQNNGLSNPKLTNSTYGSIYSYSGGTRSAVSAMLHQNVRADRLVLISPISGANKWGVGKWELQQLRQKYPQMEIVVFQSQKDNDLFAGNFYQTKFLPADEEWLNANQIQVNPGQLEVNGDYISIDTEEINKQNHGGIFKYLNHKLNKEENLAATAPSIVATAHDPNAKSVSPSGTVVPGATLNYTVDYENEGEGTAYGVYITDVLDQDLDDTTLTISDGGRYDPLTRTITWLIGEVGPHEQGQRMISVNVRSDAASGDEVINYATVYFPSVPEATPTNPTVSRIERAYYWTWYDNTSMQNWILMANPAGSGKTFGFDLQVAGTPQNLAPFAVSGQEPGKVPEGQAITPIINNLMGGPVKVTSLTGDKAIASQRSLMGNSFEEVLGTDASKLSDHFWWTWYDQMSPGMTNWVMVANPSTETVHAVVSFTNQADGSLVSAESDIAPGQNWNPTFDGSMGGPVELKAYRPEGDWSNDSDKRDVIASQRVLSGFGTAFNEVPGIPDAELASDYLWTWYDQKSPGASDWVLVANPGETEVAYEIKIAGQTMPVSATNPGTIPVHGQVTLTFPNQMNGPVQVTANGKVIASQRVIFGPSFEEVPGYPQSALTGGYHWSWYDQATAGATDWVMVANPGDTPVTYEIKIAGMTMPASPTNPGSIPAHGKVMPTFTGKMDGPVEVKATSAGNLMVSQRVLWNGYFNEVLGTVLD